MPGTIGNKNAWKGDKVQYSGIHWWLRHTFGNANKCEFNPTHTAKRFEWALVKGKTYERKRENYIMLCKSCHLYYDFTEEKRENLRKSHLGIPKKGGYTFPKGYTPWNKGLKLTSNL